MRNRNDNPLGALWLSGCVIWCGAAAVYWHPVISIATMIFVAGMIYYWRAIKWLCAWINRQNTSDLALAGFYAVFFPFMFYYLLFC
jgi:MFS superfamily sulfate permease-like transporter